MSIQKILFLYQSLYEIYLGIAQVKVDPHGCVRMRNPFVIKQVPCISDKMFIKLKKKLTILEEILKKMIYKLKRAR